MLPLRRAKALAKGAFISQTPVVGVGWEYRSGDLGYGEMGSTLSIAQDETGTYSMTPVSVK